MSPLSSFSLFEDMSQEELKELYARSTTVAHPRKSIIMFEGDLMDEVYFIKEGLIKAYRIDEAGREHILCLLSEGEMFPFSGFFLNQTYPLVCEAMVDTKLIRVNMESIEQMIISKPGFAVKLIRMMGKKILDLQQQLFQLSGHHMLARIIGILLYFAERNGIHKEGQLFINLPMTNQEYADLIGTSRETVNRAFRKLKQEGCIEVQGQNQIAIIDIEKLRHLQFDEQW